MKDANLPGILPDITYVIPVEDGHPTEASLLQGFAPSLMQNAWIIDLINTLPSDIFELTPEGKDISLARRMSGQAPVRWYGQSPRALTSFLTPVFSPFVVLFFGREHNLVRYIDWIKSHSFPLTVVSHSGGVISYDDFSIDTLRRAFLDICASLEGQVRSEELIKAKIHLSSWSKPTQRDLGYKVGAHNSIQPNLTALEVAGFCGATHGPFNNINEGVGPYVEQILRTGRTILEERRRVELRRANKFFIRPPSVNLFAPAIYPHVKDISLKGAPISSVTRRKFLTVRRAIERQMGYGFELTTLANREAFFSVDAEGVPNPHYLLRERAAELKLGTSCVATLAASEISAVVRLPNAVNRTLGQVRQFSQQYRAQRTTEAKRVKQFKRVQRVITNSVPKEFFEFIDVSDGGIRVISDAHLEWTHVKGLPLCIQHDVSRIPVTPGNLFVSQVMPIDYVHLRQADFQNILILNALNEHDSIARLFGTAIEVFEPQFSDKLEVHTKEVRSRSDLVDALNGFDGAMVIFDGHGEHKPCEPAVLHLQDEEVNVWELMEERPRVPPIVVLSACDTHAADRNHATAASGFLSIGARTVLGSVFPINAKDAAVFVARLLFRIAEFVPSAQRSFHRSLTWLEVMSGMIRMQLLTDFCRRLFIRGMVDKNGYMEIHMAGNVSINSFQKQPFDAVIESVCEQGVREDVAKSELLAATANSTAIGYLQLGRPETIIIHSDENGDDEVSEIRFRLRQLGEMAHKSAKSARDVA